VDKRRKSSGFDNVIVTSVDDNGYKPVSQEP
jgi:hypothetical protein